jgi:predicted transcriptional regulator of viral defense system
VRRGLYVTVPLDASDPSKWREDPWIVASRVFGPCYVGGWTALQHWSLTEQLFRDTLIITSRPVRTRLVEVQGARYYLKHLPEPKHFGLRFVWRENVRVEVSDPSRTIIDVLDDPGIGGGVRHVAGALAAYWASEHLRENDILAYAERLGNRAVYKRLGFLLETLRIEAPVVLEACERRRSSGLTSLDPSIPRAGRITKRWNLRVNVDLTERVGP